jgi:hypothetical protein
VIRENRGRVRRFDRLVLRRHVRECAALLCNCTDRTGRTAGITRVPPGRMASERPPRRRTCRRRPTGRGR